MSPLDSDAKKFGTPPEQTANQASSDDPLEQLFRTRQPAPAGEPGEFTKIFGAPKSPQAGADSASEALPASSASPTTTTNLGELPAAQPGAFTKMFMSSPKVTAEEDATQVIPTSPPLTETLVGRPAPYSQGPILSAPAAPGGGVEVDATRVLDHQLRTELLHSSPREATATISAEPLLPSERPDTPAEPTSAPGAFTRLFQDPAAPREEPLDSSTAVSLDATVTDLSVEVTKARELLRTSKSSPPGSFTELFEASSRGSEEQPARPAVTAPHPAVPESSGQVSRFSSAPRPAPPVNPPAPTRPESFTQAFGVSSSQPSAASSAVPSAAAKPHAPAVRPAPPPAPVIPPTVETRKPAGDFTMMFGGPASRPLGATMGEAVTKQVTEENPEQLEKPGSFTELFGTSAQKPAGEAATPPPAAHPGTSTVAGPNQEFARLFNFPLRDSSSAKIEPAPPANSPGEFTKVFGGGIPSASVPTFPRATDTKEPGSFTKLFGSPTVPSQSASGGAKDQDTFADLFGGTKSQTSPRADATPMGKEADPFGKLFASTATSAPSGQPGVFTKVFDTPSSPASSGAASPGFPQIPQEAPKPTRDVFGLPAAGPLPQKETERATQIFSRPQARPAPPPEPAGPSAFTQIISGSAVKQAQQAAATPQPPAPGAPLFQPQPMPGIPMPTVTPPSVTPPAFTPPTIGVPGMNPPSASVPAMAPPAVQMPSMMPPQVQMPAAQFPPMQVPYPPPAASQPAPAAKVNWVPLIIGANLLFVVIVILILIFALKK